MPKSTKYYNLFYYILATSTVYVLAYAWFFLAEYRIALFSALGIVIGVGVIFWRSTLKGRTGANKGYATIGLMLFYSAIWLGLVLVILVLEFGVALDAMKEYKLYAQAGDLWIYFVKISPFIVLFVNLLSWWLFFPRKSK